MITIGVTGRDIREVSGCLLCFVSSASYVIFLLSGNSSSSMLKTGYFSVCILYFMMCVCK